MNSSAPRFDVDQGNLAILAQVLRGCCEELLADYGVCSDPQQCLPADTRLLAAVIGFGGAELNGHLTLTITPGLSAATARAMHGLNGAEPSGLGDWTCELANQLLGRVKSKLRVYGRSFDMELPRLLDDASAEPSHDLRHRVTSGAGVFASYLQVRIEPGIALIEQAQGEPLLSEGELLLF
jgi:hypothetical protein